MGFGVTFFQNVPWKALGGLYFFYNPNLFLSLITVLRPTFCSLETLLKDFSIYCNSRITLWYFR